MTTPARAGTAATGNRPVGRRIVRIFAALLLLVAASLFAMAWFGSNLAMNPPWYVHRSPEQGLLPRDGDAFAIAGWQGVFHDPLEDLGLEFETVEFPAIDGSTLRGWLVPGDPGARAGIVAVHGAGADRREFLRHVPVFNDPGYPVLLFDCREQGISDGSGRGVSLGIREHEDVSSAVAFLRQRQGLERVAVVGTSQGGAAVILAGARDASIDAVIAENPFSSITELMLAASPRFEGPAPDFLVGLVARIAIWRMGGSDLPAPIEVVDRIAPRPLLLMHGEADSVIPVEQTRALYIASGGHAQLWIAPGAEHARLYNLHPEQWRERVQSLLFEALGTPRGEPSPAKLARTP